MPHWACDYLADRIGGKLVRGPGRSKIRGQKFERHAIRIAQLRAQYVKQWGTWGSDDFAYRQVAAEEKIRDPNVVRKRVAAFVKSQREMWGDEVAACYASDDMLKYWEHITPNPPQLAKIGREVTVVDAPPNTAQVSLSETVASAMRADYRTPAAIRRIADAMAVRRLAEATDALNTRLDRIGNALVDGEQNSAPRLAKSGRRRPKLPS